MNDNTKSLCDSFLNAPIKDWGELTDALSLADKTALEIEADTLCTASALLSIYMDKRGASGCGDAGHEQAVESAIKTKKDIRELLGYHQ